MIKILTFYALFCALELNAKRLHKESFYVDLWLQNNAGQKEIALPDGTRCDIVTTEYAIEVDFADKWCEAIGQSLNYAMQTNKKPAIILIIEKQEDYIKFVKLNSVIQSYNLPITTFYLSD